MAKEGSLVDQLKLRKIFSEIKDLAAEVPKDGRVSADAALLLHMKFWLLKEKLTDVWSIVRSHELSKKHERDCMLIDKGSQSSETSVAGKDRYAKATDDWRELQAQAKDAEVLTEYIQNKRHDFEQAMYAMRTILEYKTKDEKSTPNQEV